MNITIRNCPVDSIPTIVNLFANRNDFPTILIDRNENNANAPIPGNQTANRHNQANQTNQPASPQIIHQQANRQPSRHPSSGPVIQLRDVDVYY